MIVWGKWRLQGLMEGKWCQCGQNFQKCEPSPPDGMQVYMDCALSETGRPGRWTIKGQLHTVAQKEFSTMEAKAEPKIHVDAT